MKKRLGFLLVALLIVSVLMLTACKAKLVDTQFTAPTKTTYQVGESLNLSGSKITYVYSDDSTVDVTVTSDMLVSTSVPDFTTAGTFTVKGTHEGYDFEFTITVEQPHVPTYSFVAPTKTNYLVGETLDLAGAQVLVDNAPVAVTADMLDAATVPAFDTAGTFTVTGSYQGYAFSFTITVEAPYVPTYSFVAPTKLAYLVGETLDLTGAQVLVDNAPVAVTVDMLDAATVPTFATEGTFTVTGNYQGFAFSFDVTVTAPAPSIYTTTFTTADGSWSVTVETEPGQVPVFPGREKYTKTMVYTDPTFDRELAPAAANETYVVTFTETPVLTVSEAKAKNVDDVVYVQGVVIAVINTGDKVELIVREDGTNNIIGFNQKLGLGTTGAMVWNVFEKGDRVVLHGVVTKYTASTTGQSGEMNKVYIKLTEDLEEGAPFIIEKNQDTKLIHEQATVIDSQEDLKALLEDQTVRGQNQYAYVKLSGPINLTPYYSSTTTFDTLYWRLWFGDITKAAEQRIDGTTCSPVFRNNNASANTGFSVSEMLFGETAMPTVKDQYTAPQVFNGDIYVIFVGGNKFYYQFAIVSTDDVVRHVSYNINVEGNTTPVVNETHGYVDYTVKTIEQLGWTVPQDHTFVGWNTKADGSGEMVEVGNAGKMFYGTLYAVWQVTGEDKITGVTATSPSATTKIGGAINLTGATLTVKHSIEAEETIAITEAMLGDYTLVPGANTITGNYMGFDFTITVNATNVWSVVEVKSAEVGANLVVRGIVMGVAEAPNASADNYTELILRDEATNAIIGIYGDALGIGTFSTLTFGAFKQGDVVELPASVVKYSTTYTYNGNYGKIYLQYTGTAEDVSSYIKESGKAYAIDPTLGGYETVTNQDELKDVLCDPIASGALRPVAGGQYKVIKLSGTIYTTAYYTSSTAENCEWWRIWFDPSISKLAEQALFTYKPGSTTYNWSPSFRGINQDINTGIATMETLFGCTMEETGKAYTSNFSFTGDIYAIWIGGNAYYAQLVIVSVDNVKATVTYNYNEEGSQVAAVTDSHAIAPTAVKTLEQLSWTIPEGKVFMGWNTKADGTGTTYTETIPANFGGNLYAVWVSAETRTFVAPSKTRYDVGEALDLTGGQIAITKLGQTTNINITTEMLKQAVDTTTAGTKVVTVVYEGKEYTYQIEVVAVAITFTAPTQTKFVVGDEFKFEGATITYTYVNKEAVVVAATADMLDAVPSTAAGGKYTVTGSYNGFAFSYEIEVLTFELSFVAPTKTMYGEGESLSLAGAKVVYTYSDNSTKEVAVTLDMLDQATIPTMFEIGTFTVTGSYETLSFSFNVTIDIPTASFVAPTKYVYKANEVLDLAGAKIVYTFVDGSTTEVAVTFTMLQPINPTMFTVDGFHTIAGSYKYYEFSFEIYVVGTNHTHVWKDQVPTAPTCTEQGYTTYTCLCDHVEKGSFVDALGHTEEAIPAVAPTYNTTGLTEGKQCTVCNVITVPQTEVAMLHAFAKAGDVRYGTLEDAIAAAQTGEVVTLLDNIALNAPLVITKELVLDLAGFEIVYTSTTQGEAMITNKGNLTINDTVGTGVINYNYVGAADSTYGKGNFTISNQATLTVNGGKITIATLRAHAKYPIDNNSGIGDAVLTVNGGHLYNYNTSAVRMFCNSTTFVNSVTVNGGLLEGYSAIWVQNPTSKVVTSQLTINGGEIRTTAAAYVNGTATVSEVASKVYYTVGGGWSEQSFVKLLGGTFNENVYLADGAPAAFEVSENAVFNGRFEHPHNYVEKVTAPTCTEQGYTTYTCGCGKSYVDNYVPATGHRFSKTVVTPATCTEDGWVTFTCGNCNCEFDSRYDKEAQDYIESLKPFVNFDVAAKGHTEETIPAVAPTYNTTGWTEGTKCSVCDTILVAQQEVAMLHAFAKAGDVRYGTLEDAIAAAQTGEVVTLLDNVALNAPLVITKELVLDLAGFEIVYTSTTQGEAMITNKGNLTINDTVGTGVINYNYVGAADSTYGKGNFTISNQATLTVNGGKITIATLRAHAKYPIDNNSTIGDAVLVINGGHLYNYNTSAIRMFCNSTTFVNSVTINGGLVEGYSAIWVQNPGKNTVTAQLTVNGGEVRTTAAAYVNGTSPLNEVSSNLYCTTEGGAWSETSFVKLLGGTFNENVYLATNAPKAVEISENATFNGRLEKPIHIHTEETIPAVEATLNSIGWTAGSKCTECGEILVAPQEVPMLPAEAKVDGIRYATLADAIAAATADQTVVLIANVELAAPLAITGTTTIDLAGYTISYTSTTQGEAMITNKGNLTINDTVGTGVINYNYVGAADSTYGKGNFTISNQATLTVNGGKITIANLSSHAKYPIDNNSGNGDAVLVINGGHLYNYNTSAIRMFCNSTTFVNSVTVNGGLVEGYCAIWVQNPGSKTVTAQLTVTGGEIRTTAKAYVNGTSPLNEVSSNLYFTTEGGTWSETSFVKLLGGTFNENVYLATNAPKAVEISENATFNGRLELPHVHTPGTPAQENVVPSTCMTAGSYDEVVKCTECGEELSRTAKTTEKTGHTETTEGETTYCSVCGIYQVTINYNVEGTTLTQTFDANANEQFTIPTLEQLGWAVAEGKFFVAFNSKDDATGTPYTAGEKYDLVANNVYVTWRNPYTYTTTFTTADGSWTKTVETVEGQLPVPAIATRFTKTVVYSNPTFDRELAPAAGNETYVVTFVETAVLTVSQATVAEVGSTVWVQGIVVAVTTTGDLTDLIIREDGTNNMIACNGNLALGNASDFTFGVYEKGDRVVLEGTIKKYTDSMQSGQTNKIYISTKKPATDGSQIIEKGQDYTLIKDQAVVIDSQEDLKALLEDRTVRGQNQYSYVKFVGPINFTLQGSTYATSYWRFWFGDITEGSEQRIDGTTCSPVFRQNNTTTNAGVDFSQMVLGLTSLTGITANVYTTPLVFDGTIYAIYDGGNKYYYQFTVLSTADVERTVSYNYNVEGSAVQAVSETRGYVDYTVKSIDQLGWAVPADKVFAGWNTKADGTGTMVNVGDVDKYLTGNLYAIWADDAADRITGVETTSNPTNNTIKLYDTLDLTGATITVKHSKQDDEVIAVTAQMLGSYTLVKGVNQITGTYEGYEFVLEVIVSDVYSVAEAKKFETNTTFTVRGIVMGVAEANNSASLVELLLRDENSNAIIGIYGANLGLGTNTALSWGVFAQGDVVELPAKVVVAAGENTSANHGKLWLSYTGTAEETSNCIKEHGKAYNFDTTDTSTITTITTQAELRAALTEYNAEADKQRMASGQQYRIFKFSGTIYGSSYYSTSTPTDCEFWRFWMGSKEIVYNDPNGQILFNGGNPCSPVFRQNNNTFNMGESFRKVVFGQSKASSSNKNNWTGDINFTGDIYAIFLGGSGWYAQFVIVSMDNIVVDVTYDYNVEGSEVQDVVAKRKFSDTTVSTIDQLGWTAPTDYTFAGWNTKADGTGETYTALPTSFAGTLYAIWKHTPANGFTLTEAQTTDAETLAQYGVRGTVVAFDTASGSSKDVCGIYLSDGKTIYLYEFGASVEFASVAYAIGDEVFIAGAALDRTNGGRIVTGTVAEEKLSTGNKIDLSAITPDVVITNETEMKAWAKATAPAKGLLVKFEGNFSFVGTNSTGQGTGTRLNLNYAEAAEFGTADYTWKVDANKTKTLSFKYGANALLIDKWWQAIGGRDDSESKKCLPCGGSFFAISGSWGNTLWSWSFVDADNWDVHVRTDAEWAFIEVPKVLDATTYAVEGTAFLPASTTHVPAITWELVDTIPGVTLAGRAISCPADMVDQAITLKANWTIESKDYSCTVETKLTYKALDPISLADAIAAGSSTMVCVEATLGVFGGYHGTLNSTTNNYYTGIVLTDGTTVLHVKELANYRNANNRYEVDGHQLALGDKVRVTGYVTASTNIAGISMEPIAIKWVSAGNEIAWKAADYTATNEEEMVAMMAKAKVGDILKISSSEGNKIYVQGSGSGSALGQTWSFHFKNSTTTGLSAAKYTCLDGNKKTFGVRGQSGVNNLCDKWWMEIMGFKADSNWSASGSKLNKYPMTGEIVVVVTGNTKDYYLQCAPISCTLRLDNPLV